MLLVRLACTLAANCYTLAAGTQPAGLLAVPWAEEGTIAFQIAAGGSDRGGGSPGAGLMRSRELGVLLLSGLLLGFPLLFDVCAAWIVLARCRSKTDPQRSQ